MRVERLTEERAPTPGPFLLCKAVAFTTEFRKQSPLKICGSLAKTEVKRS